MKTTATLDTLFDQVADKPVALMLFARQLLARGQDQRARELCVDAIAMAPENAEVRALAAEIFNHGLPSWHVHILRDQARNLAYDAALRRAVKPGCQVLEVGTGSGLFAMMAARAGAAQVVTCERQPAVAAAALDSFVRNGYSDQIQVLSRDFADLEVGVDLNAPADVMVMEPFAPNVVGRGILPIMEQAARRLLRPGAQVIPARATVRIALAEDRDVQLERMGTVEGFDLSAFNRLLLPAYGIGAGSDRLTLRSEAHDLFCFDFQSGGPFPEDRTSVSLISSGGCVNGVAQWMRLTLDDVGWYENRPAVGTVSAWSVRFFPLVRPIELEAGESLTIFGSHDRATVRIWAQVT